MEPKGIDELLNGAPDEVETKPETVEQPGSEPQGDATPRDEHGRFASRQTGVDEEPNAEGQPKAEEPNAGPPPADQLPRDVYEPLKAVRNENKELKQQLEAIQQQLARQQPPNQQPQPLPKFWDAEDPDHLLDQRFDQFGNTMLNRMEQALTQREASRSLNRAKTKYSDFDDAFDEFSRLERLNPALTQQALASDDAGEFAYKTGKKAREIEKYGSIDALLAAERAKWEAEAKAAMPTPTQTFPATTATDGSVGARTGPGFVPPTIDQLLK